MVAGDFVNDAAAFIFTGVSRVEVLLDGPAEETLGREGKGMEERIEGKRGGEKEKEMEQKFTETERTFSN